MSNDISTFIDPEEALALIRPLAAASVEVDYEHGIWSVGRRYGQQKGYGETLLDACKAFLSYLRYEAAEKAAFYAAEEKTAATTAALEAVVRGEAE